MITPRQKDIIFGTLLGDGYIYCNKYGSSYLEIKHAHRDRTYCTWLYNELASLCYRPPYQRRDNHQWRLYTRYSKELTWFHKLFYTSRKIVPSSLIEHLRTPISLAVWYMDDGTLDYRPKSHCSFSFTTNSFTMNENKLLGLILRKNFGIETGISNAHCRGKQYCRLAVRSVSRDKFLKLIQPYILPCFTRKVPSFMTPQRLIPIMGEIEDTTNLTSSIKRRAPNLLWGEDIVHTREILSQNGQQ